MTTGNQRKLSEILIEIAMQGLKSPAGLDSDALHSAALHPLMWLAHIAWNREVTGTQYEEEGLIDRLERFGIDEGVLSRDLIFRDWRRILERMQDYKRARFAEDTRHITMCGYTPQGTLRVAYKEL